MGERQDRIIDDLKPIPEQPMSHETTRILCASLIVFAGIIGSIYHLKEYPSFREWLFYKGFVVWMFIIIIIAVLMYAPFFQMGRR